jgi:poly(hydroxyalkanoate) depolymerase family esterase
MKPRFLDAMGEALSLVRNSNVAEATALIRKALASVESSGGASDPEGEGRARVEAPEHGLEHGAFRRRHNRHRERPPDQVLDQVRGDAIQGNVGRPTTPGSPRRFAPRDDDSVRTRHALNSSLAEASAFARKALSGEEARGRESEPEAEPERPSARRPLGEVLRALRDRPVPMPDALAAEPAPDFGDRFLKCTYRGAAGALGYRLYVPADHERRDLALVLMLHGCTQNPEDFALGTHMNGLADEFGLIVAYPHQTRRANPSGCWNWFDPRHQRRGSGEPAKLAGLAQALEREFGVGKDRVFAAGLSAGGAMAEVLAATYPDVFDAVGIHSGLAYKSAVDLPSAFAAMKGSAGLAERQGANVSGCRKIVFHGGADLTVHPANGERILDEAERGPNPLKRIDLDWETEAGRVSRTVLEDAEGRPVVERWLVEGGGHAWFGGDSRGSYTQSVGLDASRIMVRFFLRL